MQVLPDPALFALADLQDFFLHALSIGDVPYDPGKGAAAAELDLTDGEVHRKGRAVLLQGHDFAADADDLRPSGPHIITQVRIVLGPVWLWHQHFYITADDFVRLMPEHGLCGAIERFNSPAFVDRDDGVHRRVQDGAHLRLVIPYGLLQRSSG